MYISYIYKDQNSVGKCSPCDTLQAKVGLEEDRKSTHDSELWY